MQAGEGQRARGTEALPDSRDARSRARTHEPEDHNLRHPAAPEPSAPCTPPRCLSGAAQSHPTPSLWELQSSGPSPLNSLLCSLSHLLQKTPRPARRLVPQLRLPKPSALSALYSYLHSRKIKILEICSKVDGGEHHKVSREEFIVALKAVSASHAPSIQAGLSGEDMHASSPHCCLHPGPGPAEKYIRPSAWLLVKTDWKTQLVAPSDF